MKKLFLILLFTLLPFTIFAGPFGLKMGITLEDIKQVCEEGPEFYKDDIYYIKPVKNHPLFVVYLVYVHEQKGLYKIQAASSPILSNQFGTELKESFNEVKDRIAKTYGSPEVCDKYNKSANRLYSDAEDWFYALGKGYRSLYATWGEFDDLPDNIESIKLDCKVYTGVYNEEGVLILNYCFTNAKNVEDEQDEVF